SSINFPSFAAPILYGAGDAVFPLCSPTEGSGAPGGAGACEAPWHAITRRAGNASEAFRDPKRRGPLASRRSTCGFLAIPGRAFHAAFAPRDQPAPGGRIVVSPQRSPGPPECEVTSLARGSRASLRLQNVSG